VTNIQVDKTEAAIYDAALFDGVAAAGDTEALAEAEADGIIVGIAEDIIIVLLAAVATGTEPEPEAEVEFVLQTAFI
jgi:hypothetical protein